MLNNNLLTGKFQTLSISANWALIGRNKPKNQLCCRKVLDSIVGYQEKRHDPSTSEEFSLSKSDLRFLSYQRYGFNERNMRGKLFSGQFLTFVVMFTLKRSTIPYWFL